MSYLAPVAGIVPTISSPLKGVTLFNPFTGLNSLTAEVLKISMAVLCPFIFYITFIVRVLTTALGGHPDIYLDFD